MYTEKERIIRQRASAVWKLRNPNKVKAQQKRNSLRPSAKIRKEEYRHRLRRECLEYYGGHPPRCACCGESIYQFLAIDHVHGNGNKHKREQKIGSGTGMYCWLRKHKFPKGYQVLCHNCNLAKGFYGTCPHKNLVDKDLA
jgi:hypothetical protein